MAGLQFRRRPRVRLPRAYARVLGDADASVLDLVDHVLNKGVVVEGDVVLGLADVDLVYLRLSALLTAADRITRSGRRRHRR
jgi:hypothetical protein